MKQFGVFVLVLLGKALLSVFNSADTVALAGTTDTTIHHYEYVLPDGWMYVYDIDNAHRLIDSMSLPTTAGARGVSVSPSDGMMYISYGGDGGFRGNGSLLQFSLLRASVGWRRSYTHGVDSHDMSPDGKTIYMPDGELSGDGKWYVINASDGSETGAVINTPGLGPHNTYMSRDGTRIYLGNRDPNNVGHDYFYVASTANDSIIQRAGPVLRGVRPFTVNGKGTIAYVTITGLIGFQVCNLVTGSVLYTIDLTTMGFPKTPCITDGFSGSNCQTSHGISLSPDETEVYVIDSPNSYVHVFDVSGIETNTPPARVADIKLNHTLLSQASSCAYDCLRIGWLHHSIDGKYVYVGDCGDVIEASTHSIVGFLPALRNTRKMLEIDWQNGHPIATSTRTGAGHGTGQLLPSVPTLLSPANGIGNQPTTVTLKWNQSSQATSYRVQVATDSLFASIILNDSTVTSTSRQVSPLSASTRYFWRARAKNSVGSSGWSTPIFKFTTGAVTLQIHVGARWNLLSLPLHTDGGRWNVLFPDANSPGIAYVPPLGYRTFDTLRDGVGYWVRFSVPRDVFLSGTDLPRDTIHVLSGWNLIGSISRPVAVVTISSNPPGMSTGDFFGYFNGYSVADSLLPGFGYWVKVNSDGFLMLSSSPSPGAVDQIRISHANDLPPLPPADTALRNILPTEYYLEQAYPNPFNPTTTIRYTLPNDSKVTLRIFDIQGREVKKLVDEAQNAGYRSSEWNAGNNSSGVYLYVLEAASVSEPGKVFTKTKKMILLR